MKSICSSLQPNHARTSPNSIMSLGTALVVCTKFYSPRHFSIEHTNVDVWFFVDGTSRAGFSVKKSAGRRLS